MEQTNTTRKKKTLAKAPIFSLSLFRAFFCFGGLSNYNDKRN